MEKGGVEVEERRERKEGRGKKGEERRERKEGREVEEGLYKAEARVHKHTSLV